MRDSTDRQSHTTAETTHSAPASDLTKQQLKRLTRTRKIFALLSAFSLFLTVLFLILLEIGGTYNRSIIRNWYFIRLNLDHIIPMTVPNYRLINTIAQTLGLHDFYQVGLWGFCQGYMREGVTRCSKPSAMYWFNPVQILTDELLAGASISLPSDINNILHLIKTASHIMFAFFLTSACLSTLLIFLAPLSLYTRWLALPIAILAFINALLCTVAAVIATVMFVVFRNVIEKVRDLNVGAQLGVAMFAFMWIASAGGLLGFGVLMGQCCCCASRRDVQTGRKKGGVGGDVGVREKRGIAREWGFGRRGG